MQKQLRLWTGSCSQVLLPLTSVLAFLSLDFSLAISFFSAASCLTSSIVSSLAYYFSYCLFCLLFTLTFPLYCSVLHTIGLDFFYIFLCSTSCLTSYVMPFAKNRLNSLSWYSFLAFFLLPVILLALRFAVRLCYMLPLLLLRFCFIPAGISLFRVNNKNTRTMWEICSKLTIKIPERHQWRRSGNFIVTFEQISHIVLVFLLLTLSKWMTAGYIMPNLQLRSFWFWLYLTFGYPIPVSIYMFKVNNKDTRTTPRVVLVSLLLTFNIFHTLL